MYFRQFMGVLYIFKNLAGRAGSQAIGLGTRSASEARCQRDRRPVDQAREARRPVRREPEEVEDEVKEVAAAKIEASLPQSPSPVEEKAPKVEEDHLVGHGSLSEQKEVPVEVEEEEANVVKQSSTLHASVETEPTVASSPEKASEPELKSEEVGASDHRDIDQDESPVEEGTDAAVDHDLDAVSVEEDAIVEVEKPPGADTNGTDPKSDSLFETENPKSGKPSLGSFEPVSLPRSTGDYETQTSWPSFEVSGTAPVSYEMISEPSMSTSSVTSDASTNFHSSYEDPDVAKENLDKIMTFTKELIASGASSMVADALIEQSVERLKGDFSKIEPPATEAIASNVSQTTEEQPVGLSGPASSEQAANNTLPSHEDRDSTAATVDNSADDVSEELTASEANSVKADASSESFVERLKEDSPEKVASNSGNPDTNNALNVIESNEVTFFRHISH